MLKYSLYSFILVALVACSQSQENGELPTDVDGLRAVQSEVKNEIRTLQGRLEQIESRIGELDPAASKKAALITTKKVERTTFNHYVNMQATVQSDKIVRLGSETGGRIMKIYVDEGDQVKKGQLIATIDMESVNKQLSEVETAYELAQDVYVRQKRLWDQNIGTEIQYLEARNNVERLEKSMEVLKHQLSKSKIYSPLYGVVEMKMLKEGEMASPGYPIVQIIDTRDVKVVADLPENYLRSVRVGESVGIYFPALADSTEGTISLVGKTIDPSNRTFKVEVEITNRSGLLKPNLLAEMYINDYSEEDVIIIEPYLMQQEVGGKNFVYLVDDSGEELIAKKAYIETGKSGDNAIIVTSGLKEGDVLIDEGARGLAGGDPIQITEPRLSSNE